MDKKIDLRKGDSNPLISLNEFKGLHLELSSEKRGSIPTIIRYAIKLRALVNNIIARQLDRYFRHKFIKAGLRPYPKYHIALRHCQFYNNSLTFLRNHNDQMIPELKTGKLSLKHTGNAGDIIYALPSLKALAASEGVNLYLELGFPMDLTEEIHPLGQVRLNAKMAEMLIPLVRSQSYINECSIYENQEIDHDLDLFREMPFDFSMGNIARWYFYVLGISTDLSQPWLSVDYKPEFKDKIVIARSQRYNNIGISYRFLEQYENLLFIGVEAEYQEMRKHIRNIEYYPVKDFLEMAQIIRSSRLFIGNQSFPYAIAEGLKVTRILEVCPLCPNVIPEGKGGHDFLFQPQFMHLVKNILEKSK